MGDIRMKLLFYIFIFSCVAFSQCPNAITEKHVVLMKEKGTICTKIPKDSIELCAYNFPYSSFIKPLFQKDVYFVWYDSLIAFVMVRPKKRIELYKGNVRKVLLESPFYCIDKDGVKDVDYLGPREKKPSLLSAPHAEY